MLTIQLVSYVQLDELWEVIILKEDFSKCTQEDEVIVIVLRLKVKSKNSK